MENFDWGKINNFIDKSPLSRYAYERFIFFVNLWSSLFFHEKELNRKKPAQLVKIANIKLSDAESTY